MHTKELSGDGRASEQLYIHICMQNHNDAIKTSGHSSFEKYTSHFIWKGSKGLRRVLLWERWVGDWTELQHIDHHSSGHNSVSFLFSWTAQPGAWGPSLCWDMVLIPASRTSCAPSYISVLCPLNSNRRQSRLSLTTLTGCTCYLHRCISYFDSLAGLEVNMQHFLTNFRPSSGGNVDQKWCNFYMYITIL